jgi:integrase
MTTNRGSITKRNGSWGYSFAYTDDHGRRRWARKSDKRWKQKDAQQAMTELLAKVDAGHALGTAKGTLGDFLREWVITYEKSGIPKASTVANRQNNINHYLIPFLGDLKLSELTPARIQRFYSELLTSGSHKNKGEPLSPKTVNHVAGTLQRALNDAVDLEIIMRNPCEKARPPKVTRPEMQIWDDDQIARFITYCTEINEPLLALYRLALLHGLRRGELLGLRWSDVDLLGHSISISQSRIMVNNASLIETPKTNAGRRSLAIDSGTIDALARLKDAHEATAGLLGVSEFTLVSTMPDGKPVNVAGFSKRFQRVAYSAGLPVIRLHDARHTSATKMLSDGIPVQVVSARLGHNKTSVTLDVYAHALPKADRNTADLIGNSIDEAIRRSVLTSKND